MPKAFETTFSPPPLFRLAVRCLCIENGRVLLVRHLSASTQKEFWTFPGGLVEKGERLETAASRELFEETGLSGIPCGIAALQEFAGNGLLEVIIVFSSLEGEVKLGYDPELPADGPKKLRELRWFSGDELPQMQNMDLIRAFISGSGSDRMLGLPHLMNCD